jgi:anti-sigma28 factor (negative regulator of flagellin synthesis)
MEIPSDFRPLDPTLRKRAGEAPRPSNGTGEASAARTDRADTTNSEMIARYVEMAQAHSRDPGRLEDLRQRLADGTFTATPDELADGLLDNPGA